MEEEEDNGKNRILGLSCSQTKLVDYQIIINNPEVDLRTHKTKSIIKVRGRKHRGLLHIKGSRKHREIV